MVYARPVGGMVMPHTQLGQVAQSLGESYLRSVKSPVEQERDRLIMRHTEAQARREQLEADKLGSELHGRAAAAGRLRTATRETLQPTLQQAAADLLAGGQGGVGIGEILRMAGSLFQPDEAQARNLNLGAGGRALGADDSFTLAGQETIRRGNFAQETGLNNANIAGRERVAGIQGQTDRDVQGLRNQGSLAERRLMESGLTSRNREDIAADMFNSEADRRADARNPNGSGRSGRVPYAVTPEVMGDLEWETLATIPGALQPGPNGKMQLDPALLASLDAAALQRARLNMAQVFQETRNAGIAGQAFLDALGVEPGTTFTPGQSGGWFGSDTPAALSQPSAGGLQPGMTTADDDGVTYRFRGGNPNDPASWEPVS